MIRRILPAATLALAAALAGCTAGSEPAAEPSPASASPSLNGRQLAEAAFVRAIAPTYPGISDQELLNLGVEMCGTLKETGGNAGAIADATPADKRQQMVQLMLLASEHLCKPQHSSVVSWQAAEASKPTPKPKPTIDPGTWTVGEDVPAGTYRPAEPVTDGCYWAITKAGSNGADIIANDLPSGGRPTVVLKKGHEFESHDCGTWQKVK